MPVNIQGKQYITVAERVQAAHENLKDGFSIETELIEANDEHVLFKATVFIGDESFNGYATSTFSKGGMESKSPYEVAETSAVGRALGFAGFGIIDGIATADEVVEAQERNIQSNEFKELYHLVVIAKNPLELNSIMENEKFKTLHLEEKRELQQRISKAVMRLKSDG